MSVYKSDRGENKFEVLIKARQLAVYTIRVTNNKKVFNNYDTIANDILSLGKNIFIHLWDANNCDLRTEYELRLKYQRTAIRECYDLLATLQLAKPLYHLKARRIEYWSRMIIEVRNLARKWRDSDRERISKRK